MSQLSRYRVYMCVGMSCILYAKPKVSFCEMVVYDVSFLDLSWIAASSLTPRNDGVLVGLCTYCLHVSMSV
jgi:hypothetical protein